MEAELQTNKFDKVINWCFAHAKKLVALYVVYLALLLGSFKSLSNLELGIAKNVLQQTVDYTR